jgi:ABC-2 type transport system ATP-binding protein
MFDEPTNDVDPVRRRLLWDQVRALAADGCAVLLVTHNVIEAERAVDRLAVLDQGKVVIQGTPAELRGNHGDHLRFEAQAVTDAAAADLATRLGGIEPPVVAGRRVLVPIHADACPDVLAQAQLEQRNGLIEEFSFNPVSLEDIYIRLVGPESGEEADSDQALVA